MTLSTAPGIRRLILHIGRHKSGTTSLQHTFVANLQLLEKQGILYPQSGRERLVAHHSIADACDTRKTEGDQRIHSLLDSMLQEIKPNHHTVLLSSESFQNIRLRRQNRIISMRRNRSLSDRHPLPRIRLIQERFPNATVVVVAYIREFLDYMLSGYRQRCQFQSSFISLDDYLSRHGDADWFIRNWQSVGELRFAWFDRRTLLNGDVVDDFCNRCEIELDKDATGRMNPSIGGNLLFFKCAANYLDHPFMSYLDMTRLAEKVPHFQKNLPIDDNRAYNIRNTRNYNLDFSKLIGPPPPLRSFAENPPLPDPALLEVDAELIRQHHPEIEIDRLLTMSDEARAWF